MHKVGIDVSEDQLDVVVRQNNKPQHRVFRNTGAGRNEMHRWLKKLGMNNCALYLEATGRYWEALATWAVGLGWEVFSINPRLTRKFAEARLGYNKNDEIDATAILRFGETAENGELRPWQPKPHYMLELRDIQMEINAFEKMIKAEQSRLKCGLYSQTIRECILRNIAGFKQQQKGLQAAAIKVIKQVPKLDRQYQILLSQKGIGKKTAIVLLSKLNFDNFQKGRELVSMAGIAPAEFSSGKSVRKKQHISRVGHASIRNALYFPAITAMTHDPGMREFKESLLARGKCKKVVICAVMAKLLRTSFALIREDRLFEPRPLAA